MTAPALQLPDRTPDPMEPEVDALVLALRAVLDGMSTAHRSAAGRLDPYGPAEADHDRLRRLRDDLSQQIGIAVARVLATGGTVVARGPLAAEAPAEEALIDGRPLAPTYASPELPPVVSLPPAAPAQAIDAPELMPTIRMEAVAEVRSKPAEVLPQPMHVAVAEQPPAPREDLPWLLDAIGRPSPVILPGDATAAVDRLLAAAGGLDSWLVHPTAVQQALIGLTSAIARHVQDEADVDLPRNHAEAMKSLFSALTHWSKLYKPGFVPGLSRRNGPANGTWIDDAEYWWARLVDFATPMSPGAQEADVRPWTPPQRSSVAESEPVLDPGAALRAIERAADDPHADLAHAIQLAVDAGLGQRDPRLLRALLPHAPRVVTLPGLKTLKTALRAAGRAPVEVASEDVTLHDEALIPEDWPFLPLTQGQAAVIVGGDRRPGAADRVRETFGFATCVWEETEPRRIAALASRIRSRSVDVVILLKRYISHSEMDRIVAACRDSDTPFAVVESGYGAAQVRLAMERYFRARLEA